MPTHDQVSVTPTELPLFTDDCEVARSESHQVNEVTAPEQSSDTNPPKGEAAEYDRKSKGRATAYPVDHSSSPAAGELTVVNPLQCEPFFGAPRAGTEFLDSRDGDLAANIMQNGVLEPIVLWPEGHTLRVLSGNRRLAVVKHLHEIGTAADLPARIFKGDAVAALALAHACNQGQEKPTAMEQAQSVAWAITNLNRTQVEIGRALGFDEAKVSRLLTLANLPQFIRDVATDVSSLSENFAALLQSPLSEPHKVELMKVRAKELKARNVNLGGPQLARYLLNGDESPDVREIANNAGEVIGRISSDRRGAIQLRVNPTYLQSDAPLKLIINALAFSIYDMMEEERKKER